MPFRFVSAAKSFVCLSVLSLSVMGYSPQGWAQVGDETDQAVGAETVNAPRSLTPRSLTPRVLETPQGGTALSGPRQAGGIAIQPLQNVDPESVGILSSAEALPLTLWDQSPKASVVSTLDAYTTRAPFARIQGLDRKLLLSAAHPPQGTDETPFSVTRLKTLMTLGYFEEARALLAQFPTATRTEAHVKAEHDLYLVSNDLPAACALSASQSGSEDYYWIKSLAFCRMLAGQTDLARLSLSLLQDFGEEDPVYYALMEALALDQSHLVETIPWDRPLILALLNATRSPLPADETAGPRRVLRDRMMGQRGSVAALLRLGQRDALVTALEAVSFNEAEQATSLETLNTLGPDKGQAYLYRLATQANQLDVLKAEAIREAFLFATDLSHHRGLAGLYAPILETIAPSADLLWFAPQAVYGLMLADQGERAAAWFQLLANSALTDEAAQQAYRRLVPLALHLGWVAPMMIDWSTYFSTALSVETAQALLLVDRVTPLVPSAWLPAITTALEEAPSYAIEQARLARLHNLERMSQDGVLGLSLLALGELARAGAVTVETVPQVVASLTALSLEDSAQALMTEVLLTHSRPLAQ